MKTLNQIIETLKSEYPTLRRGTDDDGYSDLAKDEYESTITKWAEIELEKQIAEAKVIADAQARTALLAKLGITAEEASLLLS